MKRYLEIQDVVLSRSSFFHLGCKSLELLVHSHQVLVGLFGDGILQGVLVDQLTSRRETAVVESVVDSADFLLEGSGVDENLEANVSVPLSLISIQTRKNLININCLLLDILDNFKNSSGIN